MPWSGSLRRGEFFSLVLLRPNGDVLLTLGVRSGRYDPLDSGTLPKYIGGPGTVDEGQAYDLFFNDYDESYVLAAVEEVTGGGVTAVPWRDDMEVEGFVDTTTCWEVVGEIFPCDDDVL